LIFLIDWSFYEAVVIMIGDKLKPLLSD